MNQDKETAFIGSVREHLERHAEALDDMTLARLAAARKTALKRSQRTSRRLPLAGLAVAASVLLAVVVVLQLRSPAPGWDTLIAQDDLELIEDLDFYAWLEATQPNS